MVKPNSKNYRLLSSRGQFKVLQNGGIPKNSQQLSVVVTYFNNLHLRCLKDSEYAFVACD